MPHSPGSDVSPSTFVDAPFNTPTWFEFGFLTTVLSGFMLVLTLVLGFADPMAWTFAIRFFLPMTVLGLVVTLAVLFFGQRRQK